VTGSGTVQGTPDTINFQIGINTVNPLASTALTVNNLKVSALEKALMRNGVTAKRCRRQVWTSTRTRTTKEP